MSKTSTQAWPHAWIVESHGGNEVLKWKSLPLLKLKSDEILVQPKYVGLNHLDLWVRKGVPGHRFPLPLVLGCDGTGVVIEVGAPENNHLISKRVLVSPLLSCGSCEYCLSDDEPLCREFGILGETTHGLLSEKAIVKASQILELPDTVSFEEASALSIPYLTAYSMLLKKGKITKSSHVLIHAASSAVSIACAQLCKWIGASFVVTTSSSEKINLAQTLGANEVILLNSAQPEKSKEQFKSYFKRHSKRGFDCIIDHVGETTFLNSLRLLEWGGKVITCGATSGSSITVDLKPVFFKNLSLLGSTMGSKNDLSFLLQLLSTQKIKPQIHQKLEFKDLPQAFDQIESKKIFGKIILENKACLS